jgi:hypothetical protein
MAADAATNGVDGLSDGAHGDSRKHKTGTQEDSVQPIDWADELGISDQAESDRHVSASQLDHPSSR